jgi:hypothetical protein
MERSGVACPSFWTLLFLHPTPFARVHHGMALGAQTAVAPAARDGGASKPPSNVRLLKSFPTVQKSSPTDTGKAASRPPCTRALFSQGRRPFLSDPASVRDD